MPDLKITNPATGKLVATLPSDDGPSVRAKFLAAREAQPAWAALPLKKRLETIAKFRAAIVDHTEELARTLTIEVGKPITQSRNELKGLLPRLDFFLQETPRALRRETVLHDPKASLTENITL